MKGQDLIGEPKHSFFSRSGAFRGRSHSRGNTKRILGEWVTRVFVTFVLTLGLAQANQPTPGPTAAPCSLLTKQEVLEAIKASEAKKPGKPPAITWEGAGQDEFPEGVRWCIYSYSLEWAKGDKWSYGIRVSYQRDPGAPQLLREVKSNVRKTFYSVEPLRGLGEEAYWVDGHATYRLHAHLVLA